ncbi:hypothetical protein ABPG74_001867 [Tetrahymena malaccensis]
MNILKILIISFNIFSLFKLQEFVESQIDCPSIKNIQGHFSKITQLNYINSTAVYISADDQNGLRLNDIRTGDVIYKYDGIYFFDSQGIISVCSTSEGHVLAITRTELFYFNVFQNNIFIHSQQNQELFTNKVNSNVPNAQLNQPTNFVLAQNITGMSDYTQPINILFGISQSNYMYAISLPNIDVKKAPQNSIWNSSQSDYNITTFNHLQGSSILAVQLGASIIKPVNNTYTNCLVFYDLNNLQLSKTNNFFQTQKMTKYVIASIKLGNNTVSLIYNFQFSGNYYAAFVARNNTLILHKTQDLINNNYQFLNSSIQIAFDDLITSIEYINIGQSCYLLLGFGSGQISKLNLQSYLSNNSTQLQLISKVSLDFTQKYLGMMSLIANSFFDSSSGIMGVISKKNNQLSTQNVTVFNYQNINLQNNQVTQKQLSINNSFNEQNYLFDSQMIFTTYQIQPAVYTLKSLNSCLNTIPQNTSVFAINQFKYQFINKSQITFGDIDLSSYNLTVNQILYCYNYQQNNQSYALLILETSYFAFSDYCKYKSTSNNQTASQVNQTSLQIIAINILQNKIVFVSQNPLLQSINTNQNLLSSSIDDQNNINILIETQIIFIKPFIDENNKIQFYQKTYQLEEIQNLINSFNNNQSITVVRLASINYIQQTNYLILQFNNQIFEKSNMITTFIQYNKSWVQNLNMQVLNLQNQNQSQQTGNNFPFIYQVQYIRDFSILIFNFGNEIRNYYFSQTNWSLNHLMNINSSIDHPQIPIVYTYLQQNYLIIKLDPYSNIQIIDLKKCLTQSCINQTCQYTSYLNQNNSNLLSIFTNSSYLQRSELLDIQMGNLQQLTAILQNTNINYNILIEKKSTLNWRNRYINLTQIIFFTNYLNSNVINLKIASVDSKIQNFFEATDKANVDSLDTFSQKYYKTVYLKNLNWILNKTSPFISIQSQIFIIDNLTFTQNFQSNQQQFFQYILVPQIDNYQILSLIIRNLDITNQTFYSSQPLIYVQAKSYQIQISNSTVSRNNFKNTNYIYSSNLLSLQISNFTCVGNNIEIQKNKQFITQYFISAQNISLENVLFDSNVLQDTSMIGINQLLSSMYFSANLVNVTRNVFLNTFSQIQGLLIDLNQINQISLNFSNFQLSQSKFENSSIYSCNLTQYNIQSNQEGQIILANNNFTNINIYANSQYQQTSSIYIYSPQNLVIQVAGTVFNWIYFYGTQTIFNIQSSCLLIEAPFSQFEILNSLFYNLINYSSSAIIYIQAQKININSSCFKGNDNAQNRFQGGFLQIFTNYLTVTETIFTNNLAQYGAAISINPNTENANITFFNCKFQNLIALQKGAAVYIRQALNKTQINFNKCTFSNILSQYGGCVYITYPMNSLLVKDFNLILPQITFQDCITSHVYAQQGGFIFSQNTNINLYNHTSLTNNPNSQNISFSLTQSFNQLYFLGEYIYLYQSYFTGELINVQDHSAIQNSYSISQQNPVFLNAETNSNIKINKAEFNLCQFVQSGFIKIIQSSLQISQTIIKNLVFQQISNRMMQTSINLQISTKFSAIIISQSQINLQKLLIYNSSCTHESCLGGAMLLENSGGIINDCNFIKNLCYGNGGALSVLGLNQNLQISNTTIKDNYAQKGYGGGISFINDKNQYYLSILDSSIFQNYAELGGGLHLEFQSQPLRNQSLAYINNSIITKNSVSQFGGGIYYIGKKPYISPESYVSQNIAKSPFGEDYFSQPKELSLNSKLSQNMFNYSSYWLNSGEKVYKIKNQVSGQKLPSIIFELIDESGRILDNTYLQLAQSQKQDLQLNINKAETMNNITFVLVSSQRSFQFSNLYNLSNIVVIGEPGTSIFLNLTINGILSKGNNPYKIILQIQLRPCQRGEVYGKFLDKTQNQSKIYYSCQKCKQGTYSLVYPSLNNTSIQCQKCSDFAKCEGGDILNINQGFWRINDQTDEIIECINAPNNCLGGKGNNTCSQSHLGPLCENCDIKNNYSNISDYECDNCGKPFINSLKILSLMAFYILFAKISADSVLNKLVQGIRIIKNQKKKEIMDNSVLIKQIINYFQIIVVITTFQLRIPNIFSISVDIIANPTTQILYSFQCFFYQLYLKTGLNMIYLQLITSASLPVILITLFLISGIIAFRNDPYRKNIYLYSSFLYCFIYFQPSVFNHSVSLVICRQIGQISYISFNTLNECYTYEHKMWSTALVFPIILLFGLLIPLLIIYLNFKTNKSQKILQKRKFFLITNEYQDKYWFWEYIKIYQKLMIMFCLAIYKYEIQNKMLSTLFIIMVYGLALLQFQPYKQRIYQKIDTIQTFIQGVSIYLSFIAYQNLDNFFYWMLSIILIAIINITFIIWVFQSLASAYFFQIKKKIFQIKLYLFKYKIFKKYFFSRQQYSQCLLIKWVISVNKLIKNKKIINIQTGQLKVSKNQVIPILLGQVSGQDLQQQIFNHNNQIDDQNKKQQNIFDFPRQKQRSKNRSISLKINKDRDVSSQQKDLMMNSLQIKSSQFLIISEQARVINNQDLNSPNTSDNIFNNQNKEYKDFIDEKLTYDQQIYDQVSPQLSYISSNKQKNYLDENFSIQNLVNYSQSYSPSLKNSSFFKSQTADKTDSLQKSKFGNNSQSKQEEEEKGDEEQQKLQ